MRKNIIRQSVSGPRESSQLKQFLLASGNNHKAEEFSSLFDHEVLKVKGAVEKIDVLEDGKTFHENSLKKAEAYFNKFKVPVLSDDSGIMVRSLPDELGIHSARFGGDGLDDMDRCKLLLEKLKGVDDRSAYFACVLTFYLSPDEIFFFEGRCHGFIGEELKGKDGFGYDPVFLPQKHPSQKTFSEDPLWKKENSHRSKACDMATKFFRRA